VLNPYVVPKQKRRLCAIRVVAILQRANGTKASLETVGHSGIVLHVMLRQPCQYHLCFRYDKEWLIPTVAQGVRNASPP
jgi:hypothetical protein